MGAWKHFNRYGEPLWSGNTPEANRMRLVLQRCKPETKPRGGYRGKPKVNPSLVRKGTP